ncbi:hypothetical protein LEMLEM_LOCUS20027 [Lemmus lemmus]
MTLSSACSPCLKRQSLWEPVPEIQLEQVPAQDLITNSSLMPLFLYSRSYLIDDLRQSFFPNKHFNKSFFSP